MPSRGDPLHRTLAGGAQRGSRGHPALVPRRLVPRGASRPKGPRSPVRLKTRWRKPGRLDRLGAIHPSSTTRCQGMSSRRAQKLADVLTGPTSPCGHKLAKAVPRGARAGRLFFLFFFVFVCRCWVSEWSTRQAWDDDGTRNHGLRPGHIHRPQLHCACSLRKLQRWPMPGDSRR